MEQESRKADRKSDSSTEFSRLTKEGLNKSKLNRAVAKLEAQRARCTGFFDRVRAIEVSTIQDDLQQEFAALIAQLDKESAATLTYHNTERRLAIENEKHGDSEYDKSLFEIAVEELKTELDPQEFSKLDTNVMSARWLFNKSEKQDVVAKANVLQQAIKDVLPDEDETDSETDTETPEEQFMYKVVPKNKIRRYRKIQSTAISKWSKFRSRHIAVSCWLDHSISDTWFRYRQQDALYTQMRIAKPVFEFEASDTSTTPSFISIPLKDVEDVQYFNNPMETASVNLRLTNSTRPPERRSEPEAKRMKVDKSSSSSSPRAKTQVKMSKTLYKGVDRSESLELLADAAVNASESIQRKISPVSSPIQSNRKFIQISSNDDTSSRAARCRPIKQCKSRKVFKIHGIKHFLDEETEPPKINYCHCKTNDACLICLGEKHSETPKTLNGLNERLTNMEQHFHKAFVTPQEVSLETMCHKHLEEIDNMNFADLEYGDGKIFLSTGDDEPQVRRYPVERIIPVMPSEVMKRGRGRPRVHPFGSAKSNSQGLKKNKYRRRKQFGITRKRRTTDKDDTGDEDYDDYRMHGYGIIKRSYSRRKQDFDIDNIVIPSHVSANTRVEKLEYKEIIIPSFRVIEFQPAYGDDEPPTCSKRSGVKRGKRFLKKVDNDYEDLDDELIKARHERCLEEEKRKFNTVYRANLNRRRRTDSTTDPQQNPDSAFFKGEKSLSVSMEIKEEMSPPPTPSSTPSIDNDFDDQPMDIDQPILSSEEASLAASAIKFGQSRRRTVSSSKTDEYTEEPMITPFQEREFPLDEETYNQMESEMPDPDYEEILS